MNRTDPVACGGHPLEFSCIDLSQVRGHDAERVPGPLFQDAKTVASRRSCSVRYVWVLMEQNIDTKCVLWLLAIATVVGVGVDVYSLEVEVSRRGKMGQSCTLQEGVLPCRRQDFLSIMPPAAITHRPPGLGPLPRKIPDFTEIVTNAGFALLREDGGEVCRYGAPDAEPFWILNAVAEGGEGIRGVNWRLGGP